MKKIFLFLMVSLFLVGFVFAVDTESVRLESEENDGAEQVAIELEIEEEVEIDVEEGNRRLDKRRQIMKKKIQLLRKNNQKLRLRAGNFSADCDCNLTEEQFENRTRLMARLSNGRNVEVKVMPDRASKTALARLRLRACSEENNCSIELKEVGEGNKTKLAYKLKTRRRAKFLGLFGTEMDVEAEIDAETGEIIKTRKPWWAFLASESEELVEKFDEVLDEEVSKEDESEEVGTSD